MALGLPPHHERVRERRTQPIPAPVPYRNRPIEGPRRGRPRRPTRPHRVSNRDASLNLWAVGRLLARACLFRSRICFARTLRCASTWPRCDRPSSSPSRPAALRRSSTTWSPRPRSRRRAWRKAASRAISTSTSWSRSAWPFESAARAHRSERPLPRARPRGAAGATARRRDAAGGARGAGVVGVLAVRARAGLAAIVRLRSSSARLASRRRASGASRSCARRGMRSSSWRDRSPTPSRRSGARATWARPSSRRRRSGGSSRSSSTTSTWGRSTSASASARTARCARCRSSAFARTGRASFTCRRSGGSWRGSPSLSGLPHDERARSPSGSSRTSSREWKTGIVLLFQLLGDVEVYLGALAFRDRATAKGLAVSLPESRPRRRWACARRALQSAPPRDRRHRPCPCDVQTRARARSSS